MRWMLAVALMAGTVAGPAMAEPMQAAAPATPPCAPPAEFAGWAQRHAVTAATRMGGDPVPLLAVGEAVDLTLVPAGRLSPVAPFDKPPAESDLAGLATFRVALGGTYRIALGHHAWIDVVAQGKPVASVAHAPGPACAGIAKRVDFRLEPGTYTLQLSGSSGAVMPVMIARLP